MFRAPWRCGLVVAALGLQRPCRCGHAVHGAALTLLIHEFDGLKIEPVIEFKLVRWFDGMRGGGYRAVRKSHSEERDGQH